jgi:hypothetical protein
MFGTCLASGGGASFDPAWWLYSVGGTLDYRW